MEVADAVGPEAPVKVLHAVRGSASETLALDDFIDQPFQARLPDGANRCYLARA